MAHGKRQTTRRCSGDVDQLAPTCPAWQVDGHDVRSPRQQRRVRTHLGSGTEHDEGSAPQVEPLRGVAQQPQRVHRRRLGRALGLPKVKKLAEVGALNGSGVVVERQWAAHELSGSLDGGAGEVVRARDVDGVQDGHFGPLTPKPHRVVQRREAVGRDESGVETSGQARHLVKVLGVLPEPLPLGTGGVAGSGVDASGGGGDDVTPHRLRGALTGGQGEDDSGM